MLPENYHWRECPQQPGRWELFHGGRICAIVLAKRGDAHVTLGTDESWTARRKHGTARTLELGRKHAEWWAAWRERRRQSPTTLNGG